MWKVESYPVHGSKENSRKNVESTSWLFLAACDKIQESWDEQKRNRSVPFQAEFRGNKHKGVELDRSPNKTIPHFSILANDAQNKK